MVRKGKSSCRLRDKVYPGSWWWTEESKAQLQVQVTLEYCTLLFTMEIKHGHESYGNYHGNHSVLHMSRHAQVMPGRSLDEAVDLNLRLNSDFIFFRRDYMYDRDRYDRQGKLVVVPAGAKGI